MREPGVQRVHLRSARGHRIGDHVRTRLHRGGQVSRSVSVECVDAYHGCAPRFAPAPQQVREASARLFSAIRWCEILKVNDQRVGAGAEQPSAPQVWSG